MASSPKLPGRQVEFATGDLFNLLRSPEVLIGESGSVSLRSVAVRAGHGKWYNFASVCRLVSQAPDPAEETVELGSTVLLARVEDPRVWRETEDLERFLAQWRVAVGVEHGFHFSESLAPERLEGQNDWMSTPGWLFRLAEDVKDQGSYQPPRGPLFHPQSGIFGASVGALTADWLGYEPYRNEHGIRHEYHIVIPDLRAQISRLEAEGNQLKVRVTGIGAEALYCGVASRGYRGDYFQQVVPVIDGSALFDFPGSVSELELWVLNEDGEWLDRYSENEYRSSRDRSIYNEPRASIDPAFADLKLALETGESNQIEFKPFIKAARGDDKAQELIRAASAFANTSGGVIFLGVTDNLEPIGVLRDLRKEYAAPTRGDVDAMEDSYIRDLKKLFGDGLDPLPTLAFDWISFAEERILRVAVREGMDKPYTLALSGDIYTRRGANNVKLRHVDIPRFFSPPG